jgi:hypothetical protein
MKLKGPKKASAENEVNAVEAAIAAASTKRLLIDIFVPPHVRVKHGHWAFALVRRR